jgi:signal transduction histidine kinase
MLVTPLAEAAVGGAVIAHADVTKPKRTEQALHETHRQLAADQDAMTRFHTGSLLATPMFAINKMTEQFHSFQTRVVQLSRDFRQNSHRLHSSILEDLELSAALRELCEEYSARAGIEVLFEEETLPKDLPVDEASCLYPLAQEALHSLKHARTVHTRLKVSPQVVHLYIEDGVLASTQTQGCPGTASESPA